DPLVLADLHRRGRLVEYHPQGRVDPTALLDLLEKSGATLHICLPATICGRRQHRHVGLTPGDSGELAAIAGLAGVALAHPRVAAVHRDDLAHGVLPGSRLLHPGEV